MYTYFRSLVKGGKHQVPKLKGGKHRTNRKPWKITDIIYACLCIFYSSLLQRTSQIQTTSKGSKSTYLPPPPPSPKKRLFSSKLNLQVPLIVKMLASVFLNHPLSERVDLFFLSRYPCLWKDLPLFDVYLLHPKPGTFIIHK